MLSYRVKYRELSPAQRNPFRPKQVIKRGPWRADQSFDSWEGARLRGESITRSMREVAVFVGKLVIVAEYGRLPLADPMDDCNTCGGSGCPECGCADENQ